MDWNIIELQCSQQWEGTSDGFHALYFKFILSLQMLIDNNTVCVTSLSINSPV